MAMSCKLGVFIVDEFIIVFDVMVQKVILEFMVKVKIELGFFVIFIIYDLGVIFEIVDWVLVMYKGKIVEEGRVEVFFFNFKYFYIKSLLACCLLFNYWFKCLLVVSDFMEVKKLDDGVVEILEKVVIFEAVICGQCVLVMEQFCWSWMFKQ